jgi:AhpD family alkylhydroperoxidase
MAASEAFFADVTVSERGQRAVDRLKEVLGVPTLPSGLETLAASENGIYDVYMNLNRQLADGKLERRIKLLVAVGIASVAGSAEAVEYFSKAAVAAGRTPAEALEAVSVASACSAFNTYYKFRDLVSPQDLGTYEAFKANFNANTFVKPALPVAEVEAICIAVSVQNGCRKCVQGHIEKALTVGVTHEQIDEVIKVAGAAYAASVAAGALENAETGISA